MISALKYAWLTIKHKWFVFLGGLKVKAPLMALITHDLSKFRWSELPHYGRQFFGKADDPEGFIRCWIRHQNRNPHHWEWWIPRTGHNRCTPPYPDNHPVPMVEGAIREMIADWLGAGRAYNGKWPDPNNWTWFEDNFHKMRLHPDTRQRILEIVVELQNEEAAV
jgi:hypothetical protein